jgi:hypothetical protein
LLALFPVADGSREPAATDSGSDSPA